MLFVSSLILSLYFCSLLSFSFVTHPVSYCFLLLFSAFNVVGYTFVIMGFSWYMVLFCLVYVGGVYVLFIFVSMHSPNPSSLFGEGVSFVVFAFVVLSVLFMGLGYKYKWVVPECSHYLCSYFEGPSYLLLCAVLMLGFVVISVVSSDKDAFFR
uniref:NADH dehydrogenase subunit 6 n=1 Tax=Metagonimus yokogawai TaxID=84529 RepID=V9ND99_9TREM|nr:NADH dehydrogenase subunit 6 [Metagonimus yokogawai]AGN12766.1 NADH dehydrogenase subunit 6 [Metagonimus yokogawai]